MIFFSFFHSNQNVILVKCFKLLCQEQQMKIHFNALEGSYALCLTANLIHLVLFQKYYKNVTYFLRLITV